VYLGKKITVYFPCRNEGNHLSEVLKHIPDFVDEIIVVSNRSTDNTVEVAKKLGVKVYIDDRVDENGIGYGFAHMTGIEKGTGDILIPADGDCTYPIDKIQNILDHFITNKFDFLSCNRYPVKQDTKIPFKLQLGVQILNLQIRFLFNKSIKDSLSGMWLMSSNIKQELKLTQGGWNLSPEIKINAATNSKIKFGEYHITQNVREGSSHQQYFKTGFNHLIYIFKRRFINSKI